MTTKIEFQKLWVDEKSTSIDVSVFSGTSIFTTNVVTSLDLLLSQTMRLKALGNEIYGGIFDLTLGNFGEEYAYGAVSARMHFTEPGVLSIACCLETEFFVFGKRRVANNARIYLCAEVNSLDIFIFELENLVAEKTQIATLHCYLPRQKS